MGNVGNVVGLVGIFGLWCCVFAHEVCWSFVGPAYKAKRIWGNVIEKIECRLASWKMLYLSKGGRITLIKSILSNLLAYFVSLFPLATIVGNRIKKLLCDLLWGGLGKEYKYYLVCWFIR